MRNDAFDRDAGKVVLVERVHLDFIVVIEEDENCHREISA